MHTVHTDDMDNETAVLPDVPAEIREAARQARGGWLDEVVGTWRQQVPMSAIKGSWRLDGNGELTGEYVENKDFDPTPPRRSGCPFGY